MTDSFAHHGAGKPNVHFGAVYFRKSAPPAYDWERDYGVAVEDGHNMFRHWFPWGAIEQAPGVFDWADFDKQLDLAAKNGIDTIIAEMVVDAPEWFFHKYPHARMEMMDGHIRSSEMHVSCITGGSHCMCLDNPEVEQASAEFLRQLALRYRDHPGLFGYDVWNECSKYHPRNLCYCPATQKKFREWLKKKYGDIKTLGNAWLRYSYTSWDEVYLPRAIGPYPDVLDSIRFFNDNAFEWMKWRVDIIKSVDSKHPVTAHGNGKSFVDIAPAAGDDYRAGELVDIFGYTYWYANRCHPLLAGDMIRCASKGKEFWRAEAVGNSEWPDRKPGQVWLKHKDYMAEPEEIRLDALISFVAGSRGYLNPRWRPMLNGPLFGAYGWYGLDGSRTERSEEAAKVAKWVNAPQLDGLWQANPLTGEAAILLLEEAQAWCYAYNGDTQIYSWDLQGAYEAFLNSNIQCDIIKLDQIDKYKLLYLPYPLLMSDQVVDTLMAWVKKGRTLVSEAGIGYFNDAGRCQEQQPNRGLEKMCGCRELDASFAPDRWDNLTLTTARGSISGALYRQSFTVTGGTPRGWYDNGEVAVVENSFGKGRVLLAGTMPGYAYKTRRDDGTRQWFADLLSLAGQTPLVQLDRPCNVAARLWSSPSGQHYLWVVNMGADDVTTTVTVDPAVATFSKTASLRGAEPVKRSGQSITLHVGGRDASVLALS